jgi:GTP-binding protein Era
MAEPAASESRCGFAALIGAPNAGKSTLVNALVGTKVSIVTPKAQTTRTLIRGIAVDGPAQLILVDTPGIFAPRRRLDRAMVGTAWGGARDADIAALVVDSRKGVEDEDEGVIRGLAEVRAAKLLVLNKVDVVAKPALLALTQILNERAAFAAIFMISALTGDGVADLKRWLGAHVPAGPWLYPADQIADAPLRQLAAEITREKLYLRLHQELPYQSTVETEVWKEPRTARCASSRRSMSSARASARSCSAGRPDDQGDGAGARRHAVAIEQPVHLFSSSRCGKGGATTRNATARWAWSFLGSKIHPSRHSGAPRSGEPGIHNHNP